ncbi:hypothetical protein SPRG_04680 [Saprolegnia parasitica CBS 223.65]|uniref:Ubiquitinyl hydrolase 1 n=1 Tax=Saprolegnia parasitica (strain CBS 223.65) TaxID=695850 RepID=A0A067CJ80_SAPPC|nr:hypothetical protein SPRG_04680 [Saprolegnia parasitica CBS 223.65]KDO30779.1 hypothetical protein SPRG_04680 [Saprolegnia parasitica CBS 223.65]|eukprot:XP_012198477.1 hypothetical protein SPRG_04680 [Saprolegnia parasitica CBS 223.65]
MAPLPVLDIWQRFQRANGPMLEEDALKEVGLVLATKVATPDDVAASLAEAIERMVAVVQEPGPLGATNATLLLLQLVMHTFHGLKVAKRFECLDAASTSLAPALLRLLHLLAPADGALFADTRLVIETVSFLSTILVGYQHASTLYTAHHASLLGLIETFGSHPSIVGTAVGATTSQLLVQTALCLVNVHRGCPERNANLLKALLSHMESVPKPRAADIETTLRECSWLLALTPGHLPSIEGLWTMDEYGEVGGRSRNASSLVLSTIASCHAVPFTAAFYANGKKTIELSGAAVAPLALLQAPPTAPGPWSLEGQWRQLLADDAPNAMQPIAVAVEWACSACTVVNAAAAPKCTTCGTVAPPPLPSSLQPATNGSNPAPVTALLHDDAFMALQWSRGEQKGAWLARKQVLTPSLQLPPASIVSPTAYTLHGDVAHCLVVEKPVSVNSHCSTTIELHVRVEATAERQVFLANGEFSLACGPHETLVWTYGQHVLSASLASSSGDYHHIALVHDELELILVLNGAVAARTPRVKAHEDGVAAKILVLGAEPTELTTMSSPTQLPASVYGLAHPMHGSIVELRVWSIALDLGMLQSRATAALPADTPHLLLYLPLVGSSEHLVMDHGPYGNHASQYMQHGGWPVAPSLAALPVSAHRWGVLDGFFLYGAVRPGATWMLESGSAIWHRDALGLPHTDAISFQTTVATSFPAGTKASMTIALANVSYWQQTSLIDEVSALHAPTSSPPALFVHLTQHANDAGVAIGLYVLKAGGVHCLSLATSLLPAIHAAQVSYDATRGTLSVALNDRVVSMVSVDVALALDLSPTSSSLRAGLIVPNTSDIEDSVSIGIGAWHLAVSPASATTTSALRAVYGLVGPHVEDAHASATVSCSKYHTDGSAITQELFGCQSCNTNLVFCKTCAAWCHEGHELVWKGKAAGACGCRSRGAAACHCPEPVPLPADRPALGEPTYSLWCCPQCTVINAVDKAVCSVCGCVSPVAAPTPLQDLLSPLLETPSMAAEWSCDACTMLNSASATKCTVCDTAKPGGSSSSSSTALLALASAASETMQQPSVSSGPWSCGACTMGNEASHTICHICGTPRPIDVVAVATPATAPTSPISVAAAPPPAPVSTARLDTLLSLQAQKMARVPFDLAPFATGPTTWETTAGLLVLEYAPHNAYIGDLVTGSYVDGDGSLVGLLQPPSSATGPLELRGQYKPSSTSVPNSFLFQMSPQSRLDGLWFRGDGAGSWRCTFTSSTHCLRGLNGAPFYSGLVNMSQNLTNVCYQNSFLQALFMTRACRDALLSSPTSTNPNAVVSTLQTLFGRLLQSQAPAIATHALQRCLPPTFQAGRQQDTSDFANFIMEALSDDVSRIFGGSQASIRRCKACDHTAVTHEYFWELLLNMIELRYTPITDITGVTGTGLTIPCPLGFDRLNCDLNKDRTNAPYVYLCVKRDVQATPITDIMIKVADVTEPKPHVPGYTRMDIDLNVGGSAIINLLSSPIKKGSGGGGKKQVYLFYSRDPTGSPITDLDVVYGTDTVPDGFRAIRVDLNQGDGTPVYLCYRSDMPITDLKLVTEGRPGYKLLDHSLHLASTDHQYIAHTDGGHGACVTGLQLVPAADVESRKSEKWEDLGLRPAPANGAKLMLQRGHGNPLYAIEVFRAPRMVPKFSDYEVISLHAPSPGPLTIERLHGLWKAGDDCERSKRALQLHHIAPSLHPSFRVRGSFGTKGAIHGVLQWLAASGTYVLHGHWTDATTKHPQVAHLLFRGDALEGTIGDAKSNKNVVLRGTHVSSTMTSQHPVTDLLLVRKSTPLPPGVSLVATPIHADLYLAVRRDPNAPAIKDVCVVYGDVDPIPDDYVCLHTTVHGTSGNLNDGAQAVPLFICFKRDANPATLGLADVSILSGSDVPERYTKIGHTPLGMEANLQPGKPLFLAYKRGSETTSSSFVEHPLNGQFDTSLWGPLQLVVAETLPVVYDAVGKFGFTLHGNAAGNGAVRGVLYPTTADATSFHLVGYWETTFGSHNSLSAATYSPLSPLHASTQPMELRFSLDGSIPTASGFWAQGNSDGGKWALVADCYVHIGFKKDYGSEWAHGALQTSDRVSSHALPSLLRRLVSPRTLGGDFTCGHCHARAESRVHSTIVSPPSHLILTLKRMHYDWKLQKTCKSLHDVSFPSRLTLPPLDAADAAVLGASEDDLPRGYGLYAVLVHSGLSANSGHYYSYCRDSSSGHLDLADDDDAPWIKFNDATLAVSSWAEMNQAMATSVSDSVYLLFYKRLETRATTPEDDDDDEEAKSEDEEAMLLAKAMALSMSSTQAALASLDHVVAFSPATKVLIQEIEAENTARMLAAQTSHVAMDDLHTVVRASSSVPEPYKSALEAALA